MGSLNKRTITDVIRYCNRDLVPDKSFKEENVFPSEWFSNYFDFIGDKKIQQQLGDAFYQARFLYKLMSGLRLPLHKQYGVVNFQIIQYASICEAVLDVALTEYFKSEAEDEFSVIELNKDQNAVAKDLKISRGSAQLYICSEKKKKGVLKRTRVDFKTGFAVKKGLITTDLKTRLDALYDLRNNVHILKAAETGYKPKLREAKEGFVLMRDMVEYIKQYYKTHNSNP